jgi:acyl-CoA thioester hydrolase
MKIFKTDIRVPFADTDRMGIVYHTNYIKYFEYGRTEFLRQAGYPYAKLEEDGVWLPVASVFCEYKSPAKYDDLLTVSTKVGDFKGATILMKYEIHNKETGILVAWGETKHPVTDDKLKPIRLRNVNPKAYKIFIESL